MSSVRRILGAFVVILLHPALPLAADPQLPVSSTLIEGAVSSTSAPQTVAAGVPLSLTEAVELSRQQHPLVAAALLEAEAVGYSAEQVGKWANPEVQFYQEQFSTNPDIDQIILSVSQRIRIGGQLGLASEAGQSLRDAARAEAGVTQEQLTLLVEQTYARLYRLQESLAALEDARVTVADVLGDLEARLQEGDVAPFDLARMRIEDESLRTQQGRLQAEQRASWQQLGFLISSSVPEGGWVFSVPLVGEGSATPARTPGARPRASGHGGPSVEEVAPRSEGFRQDEQPTDELDRTIEQRYDMKAVALRMNASAAQAKAAGREAVPDLVVNLGYTRLDPGINGFVWGVNATIPIFNTNSGSEAARLAEGRRLEREYAALAREAEAEALGAWQEYSEVAKTLRELREAEEQRLGILPIARMAYEEGEITVTGLLDAARAELDAGLRELELEYLEADAWFRWRYASGQYLGGEEAQ